MKPDYIHLSDDVEFNRYQGIEYPVYWIAQMTDDEQELTSVKYYDYNRAYRYAENLAAKLGIEFVNDATKLI